MRDMPLSEPCRSDRSAMLIFSAGGAPRVLVFGRRLRVFARQYLQVGVINLQGKSAPQIGDFAEPRS